MKILFITIISIVTFQASAAIDCDIKIGVDKKTIESKAVFKVTKSENGITSYETEKDGYTFKADVIRKTESNIGSQLNIIDQGSNSRTAASYEEIKPDKTLMVALANEKANPPKFAKLTCRLKP